MSQLEKEFIIEIDYTKSPRENAVNYFEASKSARKKIDGFTKAIEFEKKKRAESEKKAFENKESLLKTIKQNKKWFSRYRWFYTSDNFLVIGGKDAQSNEEIVKKRMLPEDLYFHAEVFGAPHCVLKTDKKEIPLQSKKEVAQFAGTFSKAWQEGRTQADVYSVKPEQVSKKAPTGESLGSGAFMIYGEREWFKKTILSCAIGFYKKDNCLMSGPLVAVKKHCSFFVEINQGTLTKEECAKKLKEIFSKKGLAFKIDDFVSVLPTDKLGL